MKLQAVIKGRYEAYFWHLFLTQLVRLLYIVASSLLSMVTFSTIFLLVKIQPIRILKNSSYLSCREQNVRYHVKGHKKLGQKQVSKLTLHFVWGHLSKKNSEQLRVRRLLNSQLRYVGTAVGTVAWTKNIWPVFFFWGFFRRFRRLTRRNSELDEDFAELDKNFDESGWKFCWVRTKISWVRHF